MSTKYEYFAATLNYHEVIYSVSPAYQTFTPSTAHVIVSVDLRCCHSGTGQNFTVTIKACDGAHKPTGAVLCSGTYDITTTGEAYTYSQISVTLGAGSILNAGSEYCIILSVTSANPNGVFWQTDGANYAGGVKGYSSNGGATWTVASQDSWFAEYGDPPPIAAGGGTPVQCVMAGVI
jgi:hypothetical protein